MLILVVLQALINVALDHFAIPGDVSFPLNQAFEAPRDRQDAESLRACVLRFDSARLSLIILQVSLASAAGDRHPTAC